MSGSVRIDGVFMLIPDELLENDIERIPDDIRESLEETLERAKDGNEDAWLVLATLVVLHEQPRASWLECELFVQGSRNVAIVE